MHLFWDFVGPKGREIAEVNIRKQYMRVRFTYLFSHELPESGLSDTSNSYTETLNAGTSRID
jgi:hypothetical protein